MQYDPNIARTAVYKRRMPLQFGHYILKFSLRHSEFESYACAADDFCE